MGKFYLFCYEGGHRLFTGNHNGYESLAEAIREAEKRVDDALPHNTIHVLRDMGYAALAGDGGTYWSEIP